MNELAKLTNARCLANVIKMNVVSGPLAPLACELHQTISELEGDFERAQLAAIEPSDAQIMDCFFKTTAEGQGAYMIDVGRAILALNRVPVAGQMVSASAAQALGWSVTKTDDGDYLLKHGTRGHVICRCDDKHMFRFLFEFLSDLSTATEGISA
jgi:hypothetical protein